jgi:hypothetical protein
VLLRLVRATYFKDERRRVAEAGVDVAHRETSPRHGLGMAGEDAAAERSRAMA